MVHGRYSPNNQDQFPFTFMQDAESNPLCRRLQLKDIIPTQMQRLTKYPLLLDNIAKYTGEALAETQKLINKTTNISHSILVPAGFQILEQKFLIRFNSLSEYLM